MTEWLRRLHYLLTRRRREREFDDEIAFHKEMAGADAAPRVGDAVRLREDARDQWGWVWLDQMWQDLRYAGRLLRRSPGFTLAAVLMLGVGIGVNVAAFGFFNLIALKPLPVSDPDSLLRFERQGREAYASDLAYPHLAFLAEHARTVSAVLGVSQSRLALERGDAPLRVHFVTDNYFAELGAGTAAGRLLGPSREGRHSSEPAVVLSHAFWTRRFGAAPSVVGTTLRLNGKPATVIGVAAAGFSGLTMGTPEIWVPITQQPYFVEGSRLPGDMSPESVGVKMWARVRPGMTPEAVEQELAALTASLRTRHPDHIWEGETLPSAPGGYATMGRGTSRGTGAPPPDTAPTILAIGGTLVLLILCVACANLGGLLLARGIARERELGIRVAVGAGARRLVRQLFTESLLLGLLGAIAGTALSYVLLRVVMTLADAPPWIDVSPDLRVLLYAAGLGVLSALCFGLAPALQVVRRRHHARRLRQSLVAVQVAASAILLIVSGLLLRAVERTASTSPGFEYEHVLAVSPRLGEYGFSDGAAQGYHEALLARLRALPLAASTSLATVPPLGGITSKARVDHNGTTVDVHLNRISPEYFSTLRIPVLRGRTFSTGDTQAVMVSESLALRFWPGEDPIGRQYDDHTVIGVVGSARTVALQDAEAVEAYYLIRPEDMPLASVLVRSVGDPGALSGTVAGLVAAVDTKVFADVRLLRTTFQDRVQQAEVAAMGVAGLGASALALACLGIVGLVAFTVSQRTREIGIRMALGASSSNVMAVVLGQLRRPVGAGLVAGVLGAAALSQLIRRELFGVSHLDPIAYATATGLFVVVVTLAAVLPARRALKVDPIQALRTD
jgi:predicted permease